MPLVLTVGIVLIHILYVILRTIIDWTCPGKPQTVRPTTNPLLRLDAATLAKGIREGEFSSEAVVGAYIKRIKEVNTVLNAVVEDRFDAAMNEAKACDQRLKSGNLNVSELEKEKPLYGIPFTIKECCGLKGHSYTAGSVLRKGMKAPEDCFPAEMLKSAGAIPLCVTNLPEMCSSLICSNFLHGTTSNPYDTRYTSGGSTGGEGALIGAGASLIGIGSDLAGSIRVPAMFNGIFAHKPTAGIIPSRGHIPYSDDIVFKRMLTLGPLTRYADDLHLAMKIFTSNCVHSFHFDDPVDLRRIRVYYCYNFHNVCNTTVVSAEMKQCVQRAVYFLEEFGCSVEQPPKDWFADIFNVLVCMFLSMETIPNLLEDPNAPTDKPKAGWELIKSIFYLSKFSTTNILAYILMSGRIFVSSEERKRYQEHGNVIRQKFVDLLKDDGVLILPTYPETGIHKNLNCLKFDGLVYCVFANIFGFPSTQVPMGLGKNGLPIGLQIVAGLRQDRLGLAIAKELEKKFGGWIPPATS